MFRARPRVTRADTLLPYPTLFRSRIGRDADHPAGAGHGLHLLIGDAARVVRDGAHRGVRDYDRLRGVGRGVERRADADMRAVDQHADAVAVAHDLDAEMRQATVLRLQAAVPDVVAFHIGQLEDAPTQLVPQTHPLAVLLDPAD